MITKTNECSNICVTGANSYIGCALCKYLEKADFLLTRVSRLPLDRHIDVGNIDSNTRWYEAFKFKPDCVVHLAARVHVFDDGSKDPLGEYRKVNVDGTLNLARQAACSGVKRFIFLSSIGVNGIESKHSPFTADDNPEPCSPYAVSKAEAEQGLREIEKQTGLDVVIIRSPLVYGAGAPGNFNKLMQAIVKGIPLPLRSINNKKDFIALDNLIDFICQCIIHPSAVGQDFLVSDDSPVSISEFILYIEKEMGVKTRLFPFPDNILKLGMGLAGKKELYKKLCGRLEIDISKSKNILGWKPPLLLEDALKKAVNNFSEALDK